MMYQKLKKLYLLIILCNGICLCFSQNYQVLYQVDFRPMKGKEDRKTEYMRLETQAKSKSIFYNFVNKNDSINSLKGDKTPYLRFTIIQEDKKYDYYGSFNDLYFVFNDPMKVDWKVGDKRTEFHGYKVQEAKLDFEGRKWVALFAPEIPITSGPYKFSGLPGLIMKVYSEDGDYSFEMIELKKNSSGSFMNSFQTSKFTRIKKQKVERFIENFFKDPGSQNFKLINSYGDEFGYNFSGQKDRSYKDMNEYVKTVLDKFDNPIDKKIYLLIF